MIFTLFLMRSSLSSKPFDEVKILIVFYDCADLIISERLRLELKEYSNDVDLIW